MFIVRLTSQIGRGLASDSAMNDKSEHVTTTYTDRTNTVFPLPV